jgi:hypothetical protein|tara:strand:- start:476 stop:787 length:312 start_codon:yes stop_codon:yes gene_type:complete
VGSFRGFVFPDVLRAGAKRARQLFQYGPTVSQVRPWGFPKSATHCFISQLVTVVHTSRYTTLTLFGHNLRYYFVWGFVNVLLGGITGEFVFPKCVNTLFYRSW